MWLCSVCWFTLFGEARAKYVTEYEGVGVWLLDGRMRPDHGPRFAEVTCNVCTATAVQPIGSDCSYCLISLARQQGWQIEELLDPCPA